MIVILIHNPDFPPYLSGPFLIELAAAEELASMLRLAVRPRNDKIEA